MAVMGRKKKAVAAGWNAINKQRDEESKKLQEKAKKEDTPEERARGVTIRPTRDLKQKTGFIKTKRPDRIQD